MLTVAIPKRNKLQNIIVLTPKDGEQEIMDVYGRLRDAVIRQALWFPCFLQR